MNNKHNFKNGSEKKSFVTSLRDKLPWYERILSRIMNQPVINVLTDAAAKTIGRPWALLFGSLLFATVNVLFLFAAYYYGFEYNFLAGLIAFGSGFILGLLFELFIWFKKSKQK